MTPLPIRMDWSFSLKDEIWSQRMFHQVPQTASFSAGVGIYSTKRLNIKDFIRFPAWNIKSFKSYPKSQPQYLCVSSAVTAHAHTLELIYPDGGYPDRLGPSGKLVETSTV
jgi:hypothetical protein